MAVLLRVGLPLVGGQLPAAARAVGAPVLVSANALAVYDKWREWHRWRAAPDLDGMDVALDSAGFVAWSRYGAFPWTVEAYVRLASSRPWTWWAQMDACCEPEIAASRAAVRMRQAETIRLLHECRREAARAGVAGPVPVLQGWRASDYAWHVGQLDLHEDRLVGVGSMCRRHVWGPDGVLAVVDALDRVLPRQVRLHLFGVKSDGLEVLARHPRIASVDSMAWDVDARSIGRSAGGTTMAVRTDAMHRWYARQSKRMSGSAGVPGVLDLFGGEGADVDQVSEAWAELVADGEIEGGQAMLYAALELMEARQ